MRRRHLSQEYLGAALERARNVLSKDDFAAVHRAALPVAGGRARHRPSPKSLEDQLCDLEDAECEELIGRVKKRKAERAETVIAKVDPLTPEVSYAGPIAPDVLFVIDRPNMIDAARGEPLTGPIGATFRDVYLKALGTSRDQVGIVCAIPTHVNEPDTSDLDMWADWLLKTIQKADPVHVIALGREAEAILETLEIEPDETLPHPAATMARPARASQVIRKLMRIRKSLANPPTAIDTAPDLLPRIETSAKTADRESRDGRNEVSREVTIAKADDARQIIYAAVLDPYAVDAQNDWVPPAHVEATAHDWFARSRVIGFNHTEQANAYPVESWIVPYPSEDEYRKAMRGEPHRVHRMPFGKDLVHSGTWILGTHLGDREWSEFKKGEIDAYSIGGLGYRTPVARVNMPQVEYVDLVEVTDRSSKS